MLHVLSKQRHEPFIRSVLPDARVVESADQLSGGECLIGYGTGVIVPSHILARYSRAYNFHGASHLYPGRDPHHWAAYEAAEVFGATAHIMTALVDDGPIVGSLLEEMPEMAAPADYRAAGERTLAQLFAELAPRMAKGYLEPIGLQWGPNKRARSHMTAMFDFSGLDDTERSRRRHAFQGFEAHFKTIQPAH